MDNNSFPKIDYIKKIDNDIYYSFDIITIYEYLDETFLICIVRNILYIYYFYKEEAIIELLYLKNLNNLINSILYLDNNYLFIVTPNILFLYKFQIVFNEYLIEINKFNFNSELLNIFELNNNNFLLLYENGVLLLELFKPDNKIQLRSNYINIDEEKNFVYAFGLNSKKLKFKNKINDFIIFQYNKISFINYITMKTKKVLINEYCNLPEEYNPKYIIIDNNKNLIGFNSRSYYFFIVDIYKREIPYKFIYPGTLYYSIYSMEKISYNKYICFYHLRGCYSSDYKISFCNLFKEDNKDNTFDEMFLFKNDINIGNIQIYSSIINSDKTYIFCQPYKKKGLYLIHLEYK